MIEFRFKSKKELSLFRKELEREKESFPLSLSDFVKVEEDSLKALVDEEEVPKEPKFIYSAFWIRLLNAFLASRGLELVEPNLALVAEGLELKTCPFCGQAFWGTPKRRFCSKSCKDRYYYHQRGKR